jgi:hypothetical protein
MIAPLAIASLWLSAAADNESMNDCFRRAFYMESPDTFWDRVPDSDLRRVFDAIYKRHEEAGRLMELERVLNDKVFERWQVARDPDLLRRHFMEQNEFIRSYLREGLDLMPFPRPRLENVAISTKIKVLRDYNDLGDRIHEYSRGMTSGDGRSFWQARNRISKVTSVSGRYKLPYENEKWPIPTILTDHAEHFPGMILKVERDGRVYGYEDPQYPDLREQE